MKDGHACQERGRALLGVRRRHCDSSKHLRRRPGPAMAPPGGADGSTRSDRGDPGGRPAV